MTRRRWILLAVALVVLLPVLLLVEERMRGKWILSKARRAIEAKGRNLTITGNVPPLPEGTNHYREAYYAAQRLPYQANSGVTPPNMTYVAPGRAIVATRETSWVGFASGKDGRVTNDWDQVRAEVVPEDEHWNLLQAALAEPYHDSQLDYLSGFNIMLPHLSLIKGAAQRLRARALHALQSGHRHEALEAALASIRLSRLLDREPVVISHLVRVSMASEAFCVTWEFLEAGGWTEADLARLQEAWESLEWMHAIESSLGMERAMFLDLAMRMREDPYLASQVLGLPGPGGRFLGDNSWIYLMIEELPHGKAIADSLAAIPGRIRQFGWLDQDAAYYIRTLETVLELHHTAQATDSFQELHDHLERIESEIDSMGWFDCWRFLISRDTLPPLISRFPRRIYAAEVQRRLLITAIALHRYRLRHGAFPTSLGELAPEFLPAPPKDPMDGEPLRYRLDADGSFLLYSIGTDFKDDGGDASPANSRSVNLQSGKDWVWPRAATREEIDAFHAASSHP